MHCPFCGTVMIQQQGIYQCVRGEMELSRSMAERLGAAFLESDVDESIAPLKYKVGGAWWCPRDGARMVVEDDSVRCPECQRSLNGFLYELVELHPHHSAVSGA